MPYAPGIAYRGDQYLYQGLTSAVERIEQERKQAKQDLKLRDSYITQGEALGLNPDILKQQSLGGVAGMVEGQKLKRLQEYRESQMRGQEAQTEMTRQQIENYGPNQQRMQEEAALRMQQIREQMAAKGRHDAAVQRFGGRFEELANRPDPAVLAALRANQEALGAMGGVGVPVEALAEYAPKQQLSAQEIGLEGIKAGLDPQTLAAFIHYVAPQGQQGGRGAPVWTPVPNTDFMQGHIPGSGSLVTLPMKPAEAPSAPVIETTPDGRKFQQVRDPRSGAVGWKPLAMDPVPNPVREVQGKMLQDLYREQQDRKAATNAPAAKAAAASPAPPLRSVASPDQLQVSGNDVTARRRAAFKAEWEKNPTMTQAQADELIARLKREIK